MSDTGRQSFTDKASSAMKPDQQKPMTEQAGDKMKSAADSVSSTMQPESQKSSSQKMGDTLSSNSNENSKSMMDQAKDAVGLGGSNERK
ncbi:heat shock protein 9/12-domain-containing protein [Mucidula mucida]|nr:heat shock protein 9/12-domain-containing protein [Mucidula mucida]